MSTDLEDYRLLIAEVYELAGASRRTSEQIAQRQGMTAARWHVMSVLSGGAMSVSAIARRLGLTRQSVQRVVDDLGASGHLTLRADPADRRAPKATLTPTGQDCLSELMVASEVERRAALTRAALSGGALPRARATLRTLLDALPEPGEDPA